MVHNMSSCSAADWRVCGGLVRVRRKQMLEASEQQEARSPKASAARGGERGRRMSVTLSREEAGLANEEEKAAKKKKEARSSGRRGAAQHSDLLSCACPKILAAETWRIFAQAR